MEEKTTTTFVRFTKPKYRHAFDYKRVAQKIRKIAHSLGLASHTRFPDGVVIFGVSQQELDCIQQSLQRFKYITFETKEINSFRCFDISAEAEKEVFQVASEDLNTALKIINLDQTIQPCREEMQNKTQKQGEQVHIHVPAEGNFPIGELLCQLYVDNLLLPFSLGHEGDTYGRVTCSFSDAGAYFTVFSDPEGCITNRISEQISSIGSRRK